jgi:hypothetical protein
MAKSQKIDPKKLLDSLVKKAQKQGFLTQVDVLETFPELVLENVVVSTLQKRDHLLLLRLSHHLEVELRQSTLNHTL